MACLTVDGRGRGGGVTADAADRKRDFLVRKFWCAGTTLIRAAEAVEYSAIPPTTRLPLYVVVHTVESKAGHPLQYHKSSILMTISLLFQSQLFISGMRECLFFNDT